MPHRLVRAALVVLASAAALLLGPSVANAHTGFEASTPGDGDVVAEPVGEVTIAFTGPAIPVGEKFVALDATGELRTPTDRSTVDGTSFVLTFDPPLAGGQIGIRWSVQAPDAHPIEGSFSFTVSAPAVPASTLPEPAVAEIAPPVEDDPPTAIPTGPAPTLEQFLATDTSRPGENIALAGRIVGLLGVVFVIGGLAFLATTLRGTRSEIRSGLSALRLLGLAVAVGALLEFVGLQRAGGLSAGALFESPGLAMSLRLIGGSAIAVGVVAGSPERYGAADSHAPVGSFERRPAHSLSAAVIEAQCPVATTREPEGLVRWDPRSSTIALFGVAVILASFWFDGHTVSKGPRLVHALLSSVHVAAGSVWAGGVVSMAAIAWWRYRRGAPTRAAELVVRFSSVATVALAAVGAAGMVMAVFVLDSVDELTGTEWGQILLLKTAFVGIAAAGGAYNHFRLLPALEAAPDDDELAAELRSTVTAEALILVFVVVVTAWLVAAAS